MALLHILWDDSHIWGLLIARAVRAFGVPHKFICADDITSGAFEKERPSLLLVPGGNARGKSTALGTKGLGIIREYVADGGHYLGFCGGAGLALTWKGSSKPEEKEPRTSHAPAHTPLEPLPQKRKASSAQPEGLSLCPWGRGAFDDRLQHFMSGHMLSRIAGRDCLSPLAAQLLPPQTSSDLLLPVWWPGRFAPEKDTPVAVLASYIEPGPDFWLTDLPIAKLPRGIFDAWKDKYGFTATPDFLQEQPAVICGAYGKGSYLLSYSHLETPLSTSANAWLASVLHCLGGLPVLRDVVPPWQTDNSPHGEKILWDDPSLAALEHDIKQVTSVGIEHGLLFQRNDWLLGWRQGMPGSNINNLHALVQFIRRMPATDEARAYWQEKKQKTLQDAALFSKACVEYLLTERLSTTLSRALPEMLPARLLTDQRAALFGPPMHAGGIYLELLATLDTLAFLQLKHG